MDIEQKEEAMSHFETIRAWKVWSPMTKPFHPLRLHDVGGRALVLTSSAPAC